MTFAVLVLLALVLVGLRVCWGVPRPEHPAKQVSNAELAFLRAAASSLVPPMEAGLARAGDAVDLAGFVDRYLGALPAHQRRRIRAMLWLFEHATLVFPARGARGFRRFSKLDLQQREGVLQDWATSGLAARRSAFTALRAFVVMGVMSDLDNLRGLALAPWPDIVSPVTEGDLLYPEIGHGRASITLSEDDLTPVRDTTPLRVGEEGA